MQIIFFCAGRNVSTLCASDFWQMSQFSWDAPHEISQECKLWCNHVYLNSFCLLLLTTYCLFIFYMNMERIRSILVSIPSIFLTLNASCWCSENLNKGGHDVWEQTNTPLLGEGGGLHFICMFKKAALQCLCEKKRTKQCSYCFCCMWACKFIA